MKLHISSLSDPRNIDDICKVKGQGRGQRSLKLHFFGGAV